MTGGTMIGGMMVGAGRAFVGRFRAAGAWGWSRIGRLDRGPVVSGLPALVLVSALAGCGGGGGTAREQFAARDDAAANAIEAKVPQGFPVSCRLGGQAAFADGCTLQWLSGAPGEQREFVIVHPDGGFRRFILSADGRRVNVGAGAEPLAAEGPVEGVIGLRVADDAYRLSARDLRQGVR